MTAATLCPACAGPSEPEHPGGLLAGWHHAQSCELLASEDARAVADHDQLDSRTRFVREATETERELLAASGHTWTTEPLLTTVASITEGVRFRGWPDITEETT